MRRPVPLLLALVFLLAPLGIAPPATAEPDADAPKQAEPAKPTADDASVKAASTNPEYRERGAKMYAEIGGTDSAKILVAMTKDRDWGVQVAAIEGLMQVPFEKSLPVLRDLALSGDIRRVRVAAARALRQLDGDRTAARFAARLAKMKKKLRLPYIEALGVLGNTTAIEALAGQLRAPDPDHRLAAAKALLRLRAGSKSLIGALKDRRFEIRITAAVALAGIDNDDARAALVKFLDKATKPHESYVLRRIGRRSVKVNRAAMEKRISERISAKKKPIHFLEVAAYGRMAGCAEAARKHLDHRDPLTAAWAFSVVAFGDQPIERAALDKALKSRDRRLRYAAAKAALAAEEGAKRIDVVRHLLANKYGDVTDVGVRFAVETDMSQVLDELFYLAVGNTAAKKEWLARTAACVALGRIGGGSSLNRLAAFAKAREWWLRGAAYEGLYHTKRKEAVPLMIANFDDKNAAVRLTVRRNLKYMTGKHYPNQRFYQDWWSKVSRTWEFQPPKEVITQLKRDGYATRQVREILSGTDIVAIKGRWDKVELILQDLRVKHDALRAQELKVRGVTPKQIVLVNCEGSVDNTVTKLLQWYVSAGGYMATTDWALVNATTKTFPNVVVGYVKQSTGNDVVIVEPGDPDHPSVQSVFQDYVDLQWWLEIQAFPIKVEDPIRSRVLVDSLQMLSRYGSSAMMVEFPAGLGKVLHSTSHFYLQKEGFAHASNVQERRVFAADNLGLSFEEIRRLDLKHAFDNVNNTTPISRSYSMFRLLVNFITEKRNIDLGFASRTEEIVRKPKPKDEKPEKKPDENPPADG